MTNRSKHGVQIFSCIAIFTFCAVKIFIGDADSIFWIIAYTAGLYAPVVFIIDVISRSVREEQDAEASKKVTPAE